MPDTLLARYAESLFWLARYIERAENLARILDVNETFARDRAGARDWLPILQLNADQERFFSGHKVASAESVLRFYVTDAENPTSIASAVRFARENARTLRPLISTEMWVQLNRFHNRMAMLDESELAPGNRTHVFAEIKEACQTHTGITDGTFYRDQGWYFYHIGRYIERADQTTRLLDIKYHLLLPRASDVGSPVDISQWNALLRSVSGYHAYLRMQSGQITPARVAGFLVFNRRFPRSVFLCIRNVETLLTELKSRYSLRGGVSAAERIDETRAALSSITIKSVIRQGLHEFLDAIQRQLIAITADLSADFFASTPTIPESPAGQAQIQSLGEMTQRQVG
ncbi:MAG: alpha-E domain-containing protein [Acetobacteraceae bacterium]|nr:alpha-E domain-containing protein [Acetobacteraceae bacterium]